MTGPRAITSNATIAATPNAMSPANSILSSTARILANSTRQSAGRLRSGHVGERARSSVKRSGSSSCVQCRLRQERPQLFPLPHWGAILKSLPVWIVTIGSGRLCGRCSAKSRASRFTTSSGTISRSALARNTSRRPKHRAGSRQAGSSARSSAATMAARFSTPSCTAPRPNGGPIISGTNGWDERLTSRGDAWN